MKKSKVKMGSVKEINEEEESKTFTEYKITGEDSDFDQEITLESNSKLMK